VRYLTNLLIAVFAICFSNIAHAGVGTIRVGDGPGCSTNNIQTAINMAPAPPEITQILIARTRVYTNPIDINGKNIFLYGGYADCQQVQFDTVRTEISGAGGAVASVLVVRGATTQVGIYNLAISDGDEDNTSYGGGVDIREGPHALVYFQNTGIFNNRAGLGGGMSIRNSTPANQAAVTVVIGSNNTISNNQSLAGGGIYCENSSLNIKGLNTSVFSNMAGTTSPRQLGNGGGLNLQNCIAKFGTTSFIGNIANNYATNNGGGILAAGENTIVQIYNVDAFAPSRIVGNIAENFGGAIAIDDDAAVEVFDGIIENNRAYQGGGAINIFDEGLVKAADFYMRTGVQQTPDPVNFDNYVFCHPTIAETCNVLSNNSAVDLNNQLKDGAAVRATHSNGAVTVELRAATITRNQGTNLFFHDSTSRQTGPILNGCLVIKNMATGNLFHHLKAIYILNSTIANNVIANAVIRGNTLSIQDGGISGLRGNIISETVRMSSVQLIANYFQNNVLSNTTGLAPQFPDTNRIADPLFVNPQSDDFRLQFASPALDYLANQQGDWNRNITQNSRNIDLPNVNNVYGSQDAGAYEMLSVTAPEIFKNGFE
jgi:hypothetical protein